jgi:hypothetical protein
MAPSKTVQACDGCEAIIAAGMPCYGDFDGATPVGVLCPACVRALLWLDLADALRTLADTIEERCSTIAIDSV